MSKRVYLFNEDGAFADYYNAQESPLESGEYITPERSTELAPPPFTELQTCHFIDGAWVVADIATTSTAEQSPSYKTQFDSWDFMDLFTDDEELAIVGATMQNVQIKRWYDRMLAANVVSLEDDRTIAGLEALVSAGLITAARKAEILTPQLVQS